MAAAGDAVAGRFGAVDLHLAVVEESMEQADRVGTAADAGGDRIGQAAVVLQHLRAGLAPDDGVEVAHHAWIRVRAGDGADDVEGVAHVGHPVAHRLVERVLERGRAAAHRHHRGAQQLHPVDVDLLPLDVGGAHVDHALQAQARGHGGAGHAMLAGTGLGDDAGLAHARGQQRLADGVVHLVRTGVVEILALEQDLRAADVAAQAFGVVNRAGPADVVLQVLVVGGNERRIDPRLVVGGSQFLQRPDQGLGDETAAIAAEMPVGVGESMEIGDRCGGHGITRGRTGLHRSARARP